MKNALYLNLNVSLESLSFFHVLPFPANSFRQVKYLPHIGTKTGTEVYVKRTRPIASQGRMLPAASGGFPLKANDLKCWNENNFLEFGVRVLQVCLVLLRWLGLWKAMCTFRWFGNLCVTCAWFCLHKFTAQTFYNTCDWGCCQGFIVGTALCKLLQFQAVILPWQAVQYVLWDQAGFWQAQLLPTNDHKHLWRTPCIVNWGVDQESQCRAGHVPWLLVLVCSAVALSSCRRTFSSSSCVKEKCVFTWLEAPV